MGLYIVSLVLSLLTLVTTIIAVLADPGPRFYRYFGELQTYILIGSSILLIALGVITDKRKGDEEDGKA